jgi:predicted  nucleic acid-binding Zn-ribbon protein
MAITDTLLKLISREVRATEQELSDEANKVQSHYNALRRVHDSTNLSVLNLERRVEGMQNEISLLQAHQRAWAVQRASYEQTIQSMTHNIGSGATG